MALFADTLIRALNHLLNSAAWASQRLRPFAGQQLRIDGTPFPVMLAVAGDGRFCPADDDAEPAVTITLPADFAALFLVDRAKVFANARLSGAADFAETLAFVFRNLSWDIEGDLAGLVGDIAAHRLVGMGRQLHAWQGEAWKNLGDNLTEYVVAEKRLVANTEEIADFSRTVAALRDDLARLEKRLQRLE